MMTETPGIPGVYSVLVKLHGEWYPRPQDPEIYAYWDGFEQWSKYAFSYNQALRVTRMKNPNVRFGWREPKRYKLKVRIKTV